MNLRFPQIFGTLLALVALASIALPPAASGRIERTFQTFFAPLAAPAQRYYAEEETRRVAELPTTPILAAPPTADPRDGEIVRLAAEIRGMTAYASSLREQLETLRARQAEYERIGERLRELVHPVGVLGVAGGSRDVLLLAGTRVPVEAGAAVACDAGLVGRVSEVGAGNQTSVRLITDRGFKLVGRFIRPVAASDGSIALAALPIEPTLVEGMGRGEMRIDSLKNDVVAASGLRVGDIVVLADDRTGTWPIELHGQRVGVVTAVAESVTSQGIAEVRVRPDVDLKKLRTAWLIVPPQMMPALP